MAASLGAVLYMVSSSVPFLVSSATDDAHFGRLNACAQREVPTRTGFAVAADGRALAAFSGSLLVRCDAQADGGVSARTSALEGVSAAAFDFEGGLWITQKGVRLLGDTDAGFDGLNAVALAGTRFGAVAAEASGRVVALNREGDISAVAQLPRGLDVEAQLITSADGERVALPVAGGVFVWDARTLSSVRAEAPCTVEAAWWLPSGHRLLLTCAPDFALEWDVDSGGQTAAPPRRDRPHSVLVPGLGVYQGSCEQLPCTTASP